MIKENELRLGNYVKSELYKDILQINMIDLCGVIGIQGGGMLDMKHIEPIPITEEWLLKFGFYKNIDTELFEKGGYQIDISVLKCHFYLPYFGDWYKELEYLHQLQNLYFALTGDELKPINN